MRAAVVGYGSIGARHARILAQLVDEVAVVSSRAVDFGMTYGSVAEMVHHFCPDYVVVANRTAEHMVTVGRLRTAGFEGRILIEKPLADSAPEVAAVARVGDVRVAYNLRYHPLLARLRELVRNEPASLVRIDAGHYLPAWRPGSDYAASYSASRGEGGGVLRDLSHELDYLLWIFGEWQSLVADGGRVGDLDIDSDDYFSALLVLQRGARVTLHLNYLDQVPRRTVTATTSTRTLVADLVRGTLSGGDQEEIFEVERDATYRAEHEDCLKTSPEVACTLEEALAVTDLVQSIETSSRERRWITK